ncbi:MAG: hypothetical protein QOF02_312 [Blastocatellia bacterium]|jgi:hypothetical protein|nr:hypothetical protein [Blastocatellia bacterium]
MNLGMLKKSAGWLVLALLLAGGAQAQEHEREREREERAKAKQQQNQPPPELPAYISAQHRDVLQRWLRQEPHLRVATDKDCGRCDTDIENHRKATAPDFHPYYTVGDFNGDGRKDFAVALIELESDAEGRLEQKFVVVVFNAPFSRRKVEPAFEKDKLNLRDGGLFYGPPKARANRLFIGLFSNDSGLTLNPRGRKYVAQ